MSRPRRICIISGNRSRTFQDYSPFMVGGHRHSESTFTTRSGDEYRVVSASLVAEGALHGSRYDHVELSHLFDVRIRDKIAIEEFLATRVLRREDDG